MTPREIEEALSRLRAAGERLRRRPAAETLAATGAVLDAWSASDSRFRRELEERLPRATGFSAEVVREGLARALAGWNAKALEALVADELGGAQAFDGAGPRAVAGFEVTATLLAGSLPTPTLLAMLAPLAVRSPVIAKATSLDPVTPGLVARSVAEVDAELGACVEVVALRGDDEPAIGALLAADCVVASGSDATIAAVAARVRPEQRFVAYGHRLSVAVVGPEATDGAGLDAAARGLALDVALWDQLGCLSPIAVLADDSQPGAASRVGQALARALSAAEQRLPRGRIAPEDAALFARERSEAELRAAAGRDVEVFGGVGEPWCVVVEAAGAGPRPAPLHRFVRVLAVQGLAGVREALRPLSRHLSAVALAGFGGRTHAVARQLAALGASRVCLPGRLQSPPLAWPHDGRGVLEPLVRWAGLET